MLRRMKRWSVLLTLVVIAAAVRVYGRPPAPRALRTVPQPSPASAVARGRLVYERYGCTMCHGADGKGNFANPNSETDGKVPAVIYVKEGYKPDEVAAVILNGKPSIGRSDPSGPVPPYRMPGWRDRMSQQEVGDLVEYLMSLYPKAASDKWR